ncbi:isoleucine--tRNA ligase [Fimbriiglobus ruber]|uniref:isoleucine--tRNA ligase n=1 Tax=Fimbriiglobus ruber TaxID=1908690 RepID=A0A225DAR6_9BACT|nr:class I tRNA ligase family protein [Fimbriiglobus ruber]OWK38651.1 Isoleucyl-tRNA synthetase [Fimbriiglobus ruber]
MSEVAKPQAVRPFEKVETQNVDFPAFERAILDFWQRADIFGKRRKLNAGKKKWSFLDGPITANNPMGVHHAWGRTYKDAYNRYFAMTGHELRYQNGFDCQGLWVEVEVEKELGLKSKRDIENLVPGDREASVAKFVQLCKDRVDKFARVQTEQSVRLGYWMDWDRTDADWAKPVDERKSYFTMSRENNYTIWSFLQKCHHKGLIYRGYDVMPWCGRCGVGISEQEMKEGYKNVEHRAVFVKFPLKDRPGENLLVWTTTPWTLTSNVGAAVNPELTYLQVKLKGELYYVAKGAFKLNRMESGGGDGEDDEPTAKKGKRDWIDGVPHLSSIEQHFKSKAGKDGYEVVGEVKGEEMLGWEYVGPFDDLPAQQHQYGYPPAAARVVKDRGWSPARTAAESHRVINGGKDVTESEGTGIVHSAPGCGQIDFVWGKESGLPPVAPIDDAGCFVEGFGSLTGLNAADPTTADRVFELLKANDRLFVTERYVHRYPHCWRCKTELLYRLVDEWFINMGPRNTEEGFRGAIMKVAAQVTFLPESLNGRARERDWLWNMGDWMISKKRYWGLALPIWVDEATGDFEVIGSFEELKARAVEGWEEFDGHSPHRPYLDKVKIRNPKTGNLMSRVPDVGNPWLDAGIVAFSTMKYNTDRAYWREWYPADFITESFPGQFRNWFYALLALSTMMGEGEPPFKTLLGHGLVKDQYAQAMSKSMGNSIEFVAAADEGGSLTDAKGKRTSFAAIGADVMRWLYSRHDPAKNLNFGPEPANEVRAKFIIKLWNCYAFFANYARLDGFDPTAAKVPVAERADIDRWIVSDLQGLITTARTAFEKFDVMSFCLEAERFVDDRLSNWYVRRNRDRFWSKNTELDDAGRKDKLAAYQTMYEVLTTLCKLFSPVVPFLSEVIWQNLRTPADAESVHLCDYPTADPGQVDADLSADMDALLDLVTLGGAARNAAKTRGRQPLAELRVSPGSDAEKRAVERFADQLREELNVKAVTLHDKTTGPMLRVVARLNKKTANAKLGAKGKEAEALLTTLDGAKVNEEMRKTGVIVLTGVELQPADIAIEFVAPEGWIGVADKNTQVMLDTRITPELKAEGLARDIVRFVQDARKDAGLDVADKIALYLSTESDALQKAMTAHRSPIAAETQAIEWCATPPADAHAANVKVDGHALAIALRKV